MKTYFSCPVCWEEDGNPLNSLFDGYLGDDDISTYTCPRNHKFRIISRNDKYRILFDEAIIQLQDGFYENAILNAYTSLEEFMKFFIKFNLHMREFSAEEILDFIKTIKFAENKKGAFLLNYFQIFKENNISKELNEFAILRNNIIHNGKFVSEDEAYVFCKNIYNFINGIILKLNQKHKNEDYVGMDFKFQEYFYNNIFTIIIKILNLLYLVLFQFLVYYQ